MFGNPYYRARSSLVASDAEDDGGGGGGGISLELDELWVEKEKSGVYVVGGWVS